MSARINDELAPTYEQLKTKAMELVREAAIVYGAYNATVREPDGDFADFQTLHELQALCQADFAFISIKAERDALAVENGEMRSAIDAAIVVAHQSSGIAGWHLNGDIAGWDEILPELNIETPATSAALAAVKKQAGIEAVEQFAERMLTLANDPTYSTASNRNDFREAFRKADIYLIELREAK